jgi:hypothetical protein
MTHSVVVLAGVEPISWVIGGTTLLILVGLLVALVAFGGGREHS